MLLPLAGLWRYRLYTYRWVSLFVWLYAAEGLVRMGAEPGIGRWLAVGEAGLGVLIFVGCSMQVRQRLRSSQDGLSHADALPSPCARCWAPRAPCRRMGSPATRPTGANATRAAPSLAARPATTEGGAHSPALHRMACAHRAARRQYRPGGRLDARRHRGTQLVLSLQRLRELRRVDADNLSLTAEAGCVLADLQAAAA